MRLHACEAHRANLLCPPSEEISRQVLSFGQCWKSSANLWRCTSTAPYSTCSQMLVRFISTHLHYLAWASWASTFASNVRHKWSWCLAIFSNTSEQEGAALSQELKLNNEILARNVFCQSIQLGLTLIGFNRIHIRIIMELVMAAFAERSESRISSPWGCMIVHGMHTCEGPRSTPVLRVIAASASRSRVVTASLAP